jgi:hypothetical protein
LNVAQGRIGMCKFNMLQTQRELPRLGILGYKSSMSDHEHTYNSLSF